MHDYKRTINDLKREIDKDTAEIRDCLEKLGEHLSYQKIDVLPDPGMKELHDRIQQLRRQLPDSRQQVKKILQAVAGNEALEREIRSKKRQIGELAASNQEICESIGRAAYRAYKTISPERLSLEQLFESLESQERELAELEQEQEMLQEHGKSGKFFKIFRETGRSVYVKGRLSLRRKAVAKTYHEVGKQFCASPELREELDDRRLGDAMAPYEVNERKTTKLQSELNELIGDQEKKWNELKSLGAHRSHQKRVREIESEIQRIEEKLKDAFEGLGTQFRQARPGEIQDMEAASLIHQIEELERGIRGKEKRIERLSAALQIDTLSGQLGNLAERVARLEGEIETRLREIETLKAQIAVGEKEVQRLQRIRGSKKLLLEGENRG
jgi:chromosome segregation ATPase